MSNQNERGVERVGRGLHISRKIYMSIVSIFLVCVCLLCATTIVFMWMYISRQEKTEVERLEGQIISEFSSLNDEAEKLCDLIGNNYDIQTIIREPASDDWTVRAQERCIVNGKIALLAQSYTHRIDNVALFLLDGRQFKYGMFGPRSDSVLDEEWFQSGLVPVLRTTKKVGNRVTRRTRVQSLRAKGSPGIDESCACYRTAGIRQSRPPPLCGF